MTAVYKGMNRAALDAAYNNSLAVANSTELMARFDELSTQMRSMPGARIGLRYGSAPRNLIDYFSASSPGPLVVFIHGGYWQARAKESFSFLAKGLLAHGFHVAMVGYTLAPSASLAQIVDEVRGSIDWLAANAAGFGGDVQRMLVSGWSAGGHLTAMCMDSPGVIGGLAISGIYDLQPVRLSYLNDKLALTPADVESLSPIMLPLSPKPLVIAYGESELPELQAQSQAFFATRTAAGLPGQLLALPGLNHFTILTEMASADGALALAVKRLGFN
jgi:arylformamidase